ncbi:hypothetical protein VPH35_088735 [Triticum aestivum]
MDLTGTNSRNPCNDSEPHLGMASSPRRSELSHRPTTDTTTHGGRQPGSTLAQLLAGSPLLFWYWEEEYIDLLVARNLLDARTLLARVETRDENRDDAMSNCMEAGKNEVCKLKKPIENCNNVCNEDIEKILIQLVEEVMEVGFILKCLIVVLVLFR